MWPWDWNCLLELPGLTSDRKLSDVAPRNIFFFFFETVLLFLLTAFVLPAFARAPCWVSFLHSNGWAVCSQIFL